MSAFEQHEPEPEETPINDETLGGNLLSLGYMKEPKSKQYHRTLADIFDMQREKFPTELEFIEYDPKTKTRIVTYNPFEPEQQGTELIDAKSFLYELAQVNIIKSYDPEFNENINLLINERNIIPWIAETNKGPIRIAMRLQNPENITGVGLTFVGTRSYKVTISFFNEEGHMISQVIDAVPSLSTDSKQFFILKNIVDNIFKIFIDIEESTTDAVSVYVLKNISIFKYTNTPLLRAMGENNIITYHEIENPVFLKEMAKDNVFDDAPK